VAVAVAAVLAVAVAAVLGILEVAGAPPVQARLTPGTKVAAAPAPEPTIQQDRPPPDKAAARQAIVHRKPNAELDGHPV
jgi:hypothetical protein